MQDCLTMPFTPEFSGCLVETPTCRFAVRFGFSYLCEHPCHKDFFQDPLLSSQHAERDVDHNELYRRLKESRRSEFISKAKRIIEDLENRKP
jgi:hypothetical protein